jgi:hypothetical protein
MITLNIILVYIWKYTNLLRRVANDSNRYERF